MEITNIQRFSLEDGPGIRTTVFMAGCNMKCCWCHNPEAMVPVQEAVKEITADEAMQIIEQDRRFYDRTGGGVTFSGGEPVMQPAQLKEMLMCCSRKGISTAIETAGSYAFECLEEISEYLDLVIIDCKAYTEEVHVSCTGCSNRQILNNIDKLSRQGKRMWVRIPIVPDINITFPELRLIGGFLSGRQIERVELLPYHTWGISKYRSYHLEYTLKNVSAPTEEYMSRCREILQGCGVRIFVK